MSAVERAEIAPVWIEWGRLTRFLESARLVAGDAAVMIGTESRGASNAKAKRELGWTPRHPSWREGFAEVYGTAGVARRDASLSRR